MSDATESSPPREFKQKQKQPNNLTMTMGTPVHSRRAETLNTVKEATFVTILLALLPFLVWPLPLPPNIFSRNTRYYSQFALNIIHCQGSKDRLYFRKDLFRSLSFLCLWFGIQSLQQK